MGGPTASSYLQPDQSGCLWKTVRFCASSGRLRGEGSQSCVLTVVRRGWKRIVGRIWLASIHGPPRTKSWYWMVVCTDLKPVHGQFTNLLMAGRLVATYSSDNSVLTLHSTPPSTLRLPHISYLFSTPSRREHESIVALTEDKFIFRIHISGSPHPTLALSSYNSLPLLHAPKLLIAVDPMAWSKTSAREEYDDLLSVSDDGELCFWTFEHGKKPGWRCTGRVRTGRSGFRMASCSSAKKSVLGNVHLQSSMLSCSSDSLSFWPSRRAGVNNLGFQ